jgi:REP element-mobilizing transposase RayT
VTPLAPVPKRRSVRLRGYDDSTWGPYFVTICTAGRREALGTIRDGRIVLSVVGQIVLSEWGLLPKEHPVVVTDVFVVMPHHVHGVLRIGDDDPIAASGSGRTPSLGRVLGGFKSRTTVMVNRLMGREGDPLWQRGYYERIIGDCRAFEAIREYILKNPESWEQDAENPDRGASR